MSSIEDDLDADDQLSEDSDNDVVNNNYREINSQRKRVLRDITLPCILYSLKEVGENIAERKYRIEISEETAKDIGKWTDEISVVCHPTKEQAYDVIRDGEESACVMRSDKRHDIKKVNAIDSLLSVLFTNLQAWFEGAENTIDSLVSDVKESMRQLRDAIERKEDGSSNMRADFTTHQPDLCTKTESASLTPDKSKENRTQDQACRLRRNSTEGFSLCLEDQIIHNSSETEKAHLKGFGSSDDKGAACLPLQLPMENKNGVFSDGEYMIGDDKKRVKIHSWKIEPAAWRDCTERRNKKAANMLLQKRKLPDQDSLNKACSYFGRSSELVSAMCNAVCSYLREKSDNIIDVWPAYEYNKFLREDERNHVTFVVIKENDSTADIGNEFKTYDRATMEFNSESFEVNRLEASSDTSFDENMNGLLECMKRNSASLMNAHSNLTMVSASLLMSDGFNTPQHKVRPTPCVVLYVHIKGLVPLGEEPFPELIEHFPVDIREAVFSPFKAGPNDYHTCLRMGCAIRNSSIDQDGNFSAGTLGGFLNHSLYELCCITCAHVLCDNLESFSQYPNGLCAYPEPYIEAFQPALPGSPPFGKVVCAMFHSGDENQPGIDAALVKVTSRYPIDGLFPDTPTFEKAGFTEQQPMIYSNGRICTQENLNRNTVVIKYGCSTEVTRGIFRLQCGAVRSHHAVGQCRNFGFLLHNQLEIFSAGQSDFAQAGDSGALVFVEENKELSCIGLLEGGLGDGRYIVTPIENILKAFNLPLEGTFETFSHLSIPSTPPLESLQQPGVTFKSSSPCLRSVPTFRSDSGVSISFSDDSLTTLAKEVEEKISKLDEDLSQEFARHAAENSNRTDEKIHTLKTELKQEIKRQINEAKTELKQEIKNQMQEQNRTLQEFLRIVQTIHLRQPNGNP